MEEAKRAKAEEAKTKATEEAIAKVAAEETKAVEVTEMKQPRAEMVERDKSPESPAMVLLPQVTPDFAVIKAVIGKVAAAAKNEVLPTP